MSRTFKDRHDRSQSIRSGRSALVNAAWDRLRTDAVFAASLGFYTGVDETGQIVTEDQALEHIEDVLRRGQ